MTAAPEAPPPFAVITNREVYDAVVELGKRLDPLPTAVTDHETRLRSLERKVWGAAGTSALAASLVTGLFGALTR